MICEHYLNSYCFIFRGKSNSVLQKDYCILEAGVLINTYFLLQFNCIKHTLYLYIVLCKASQMIHFHTTISELINCNTHMAELTTPYITKSLHPGTRNLLVRSIITLSYPVQIFNGIHSTIKT